MRKRKIINWTLCSSHANLDFEHHLFNSYSMRCFFFIKKHELKYTQFRIKTASLFFSYDISSSTFSLWYIYTEFWSKSWSIYRAFSVTWSAAMQKLLGIKGSFNMWKEFNSHRIFFIHKHGRRFIVLYTNMHGRRDVMWKRSIKPVKYMTSKESQKSQFNSTSVWQVPRNLNSISDENKWSSLSYL